MARRAGLGVGLTALRAALGAVSGGLEGYTQAQERERKRMLEDAQLARQKEQDAYTRAIGEANLLGSGWEFGAPAAPTPSPMGTALDMATQAQQPPPGRSITLGGRTLTLRETMPEREARIKREAAEAATKAAADAKKARVEELVATGMDRNKATRVVALEAKYGDVEETPSIIVTKRGQDISAATTRRGQDLAAETARRGQDVTGGGKPPASEIDKRLPVGARNDIADYNAAIYTLQQARKEIQDNPGAFGLVPYGMAKLGAVGRTVRERQEAGQSEAYTKARAQLQSALMKLRKTQFGTQMTRLEKDTGEEVFPSGAESPQRLSQMIDVLLGNAENLRRGVYDANSASDLYQPLAPMEPAKPAAPSPTAKPAEQPISPGAWMDANPQRPGESDAAYEARYRSATRGGG